MFEAHQVRSKTRNAVRQREEEVEQEEIESGELNLVPYLDIVTNLMLFLLSSVAAAVVFGQLNTMLPDKAPAGGSTSAAASDTKPEDLPLKMTVSVTRDRILVWSISGLEGTLKEPKKVLTRTGLDGEACDGAYMCESGYCNAKTKSCEVNPKPDVPRLPVFDYRALNDVLYTVAKDRYTGKFRKPDSFQAILMADDSTPYETLISVINAMRCKLPALGESLERCFLPSTDGALAAPAEPLDKEARLFDPARVPFNADEHALFNDVLFSRGFE